MRLKPKYFLFLFLLLSACGWDDDSDYSIRTRNSFFLVSDQGGTMRLARLSGSALIADWNAQAGIANADLGGVDMRDNSLFVGNTADQAVRMINPEDGSTEENFWGLLVSPHHVTVGEDHIMVSDTVEDRLVFVKRKNGKRYELDFDRKPQFGIYNNGRYFLVADDSIIYIYDEKALAPREIHNIRTKITEIQFDRFKSVIIQSQDTGGVYQSWIAANGDYVFRDNLPITFEKRRMSDWYTRRYGAEYLNDLIVDERVLQTTLLAHVLDSVENFEVDFFEGRLFYSWHDSLFLYDLNNAQRIDSMPFEGEMRRSFHQYGGQ